MKIFKRYTEDSLVHDEFIIYETTKHWINFFDAKFFASLIICCLIKHPSIIAIILFLYNVLSFYILTNTDECVVTNKKVIFKTGFIFVETIEMNLNKIESISVRQNILGNLLDYGTIIVRGTGGTVETFLKVNKPKEIRREIQEYSF